MTMTRENWLTVRNFTAADWPHCPWKVERALVTDMDMLADLARRPFKNKIKIHVAWAHSGHSEKSQHYKGRAADFHFETIKGAPTQMDLFQQFYAIQTIGFNRIGFYPFWNNPGWHVDIKPGKRLYWIRNEAGEYEYFTIAKEFLDRAAELSRIT